MIRQPMDCHVLVIGHINHDRIWRLNAPLRSGARIAWRERITRLGGGGYFTACRLLELGYQVSILSNLKSDIEGREALYSLETMGFDTSLITVHDGATDFADILLDPTGERTILSSERRMARTFELGKAVKADAIYINGPHVSDTIRATLAATPLVISQLPLRNGTPRPADVVVGSLADAPGESPAALWREARQLAGARLRHLVMTDGPDPTLIFDGKEIQLVPVPHYVTVRDTIGAGDSFSGALIDGLLSGDDIATATRKASLKTAEWLSMREAQNLAEVSMPAPI